MSNETNPNQSENPNPRYRRYNRPAQPIKKNYNDNSVENNVNADKSNIDNNQIKSSQIKSSHTKINNSDRNQNKNIQPRQQEKKQNNDKIEDSKIGEKKGIDNRTTSKEVDSKVNERNQYNNKPQTYNNRNQSNHINSKSNQILSVVVPLFNEEESLPELALHLEDELKKFCKDSWEVIFVDDGSTDKSYEVIKQIHSRSSRFHAIRFRRNYGKAAALSAGFAEARGVIVITMDADLQDDPSEIPNLVTKIKEGYDLVSGWKKKRHDPITKTLPSRVINFVTARLTGLKIHDMNCGLKAYRSEVVKSLNIYGEIYRYIPALAKWDGFRVSEIPVKHHKRRYGKSKYGFSRFVKGFLDLTTVLFTTRYFKRPLHFFGTIGVILGLLGFGTDLYLAIEWMLDNTYLSQRPLALLATALIIVGVQFFSFGLVGEMIAKTSYEKNNYTIKEKL